MPAATIRNRFWFLTRFLQILVINKDFGKRAAHPHQIFLGVPPWPDTQLSLFVLLLLCIEWNSKSMVATGQEIVSQGKLK